MPSVHFLLLDQFTLGIEYLPTFYAQCTLSIAKSIYIRDGIFTNFFAQWTLFNAKSIYVIEHIDASKSHKLCGIWNVRPDRTSSEEL